MDHSKKQEAISRRSVWMDAVYLMSCALHDAVPEEASTESLEELFRFCHQHSITAMVTMALEARWRIDPPQSPEVMTPWKQAKEKVIRKNILLNAERQRILEHLDSIGCWYMPLKGSFLQFDYPKFGMRQMSDNDILYDPAFEQEICDFMCGCGYTAKSVGKKSHDVYTKAPIYHFEMHRRLFSPLLHRQMFDYYGDARHLMVKDADNRCGYHFSHADFYVYMIAHAYKHFAHYGTGIRSLADVYVFLDRHEAELDWSYVKAQLDRLGMEDFERKCRSLARRLFTQAQREISLGEEELEFLEKFLGAGTYGNRQQAVENTLDQMKQEGSAGGFGMKLRYLWRQVFPPLEHMAVLEPDLLKHRWKLPLAHLRRLIRVLLKKPARVMREAEYVIKSQKAEKK